GAVTIRGKEHGRAETVTKTTATPSPQPTSGDEAQLGPFVLSDLGIGVDLGNGAQPITADSVTNFIGAFVHRLGFFFWFPLYLAVLVIFAGQTFGMMIAGLRVVTTDFRKPSIARTIVRYLIVFAVWWAIVPLSFIWRRVLLHDRWTKTRVVKVERVVARLTGS
ncbi:MAG TPA: RDD family protein, partial [Trinickia sp.]|nr:RDD family protein [Trinickia sp.]